MRLVSLRFLPLLSIPLWPCSEVAAQGSQPSPNNTGNPPCGNDITKNEPPKCNSCGEKGTGPEFKEPCPSTPAPVHSYNGNAQHVIPDLKIAGSVGRLPLEFSRYSATRVSNLNLVSGSFGKESSWTHSFSWFVRNAGGTVAQPRIAINFPNGRELTFVKPSDGSAVWFSTLPSSTERLRVTADDCILTTAELDQYRFVKRLDAAGLSFYRLEIGRAHV